MEFFNFPGDLIILLIVAATLYIFRHRDKSSKSLEKVKKYADKRQQEFDKYVSVKMTELKDLSIEIDVQETTGKEVLKRITNEVEVLSGKINDLDQLSSRIKDYNSSLDRMEKLTGKLGDKYTTLKKEFSWFESLEKKVNNGTKKLGALEKNLSQITDDFARKNREAVDQVKEEVFKETALQTETFRDKIHRAETGMKTLSDSLADLKKEHNATYEDKVSRFEQELSDITGRYEQIMSEAAEKGKTLEAEAFTSVKSYVEENKNRLKEDFSESFQELSHMGSEEFKRISGEISSLDNSASELKVTHEKRLSSIEEQLNNQLVKIKDINEKGVLKVQEEIANSVDNLRDSLSASEKTLKERMADWQNSVSEDIQNRFNEIDGSFKHKMEGLNDETHNLVKDLQEKLENAEGIRQSVKELIAEAEKLADVEAAEFRSYLEDSFTELKIELSSSKEAVKEELFNSIGTRVEGFELKVNEKLEVFHSLADTIDTARNEIEHRVAGTDKELQSELEQLKEKVTIFRDQLFDQQNSLSGEFEEFHQEMLSARSTGRTELEDLKQFHREGCNSVRDDIKHSMEELQKEILAEKEFVSNNIFDIVQEKVENQRLDIEKRLNDFAESLRGIDLIEAEWNRKYQETEEHFDRSLSSLGEILENYRKDAEESGNSVKDVLNRLKEDTSFFIQGEEDKLSLWKGEHDEKISELREKIRHMSEETEKSLQEKGEMLYSDMYETISHRVQNQKEELETMLTSLSDQCENIDTVETHIKNTLEESRERVHEELARFQEDFNTLCHGEREEFNTFVAGLKEDLSGLEGEINDLKQKSYDGVSEKLQVFEDDFFAGLKEKSEMVDRELSSWKERLDDSVKEIQENNRDNFNAQSEALEKTLSDFTRDMQGEIAEMKDQLELKFIDIQNETEGSFKEQKSLMDSEIYTLTTEFREWKEGFNMELSDKEDQFLEQVESVKKRIEGSLHEAEKALDSGSQDFRDRMDRERQEINESLGEFSQNTERMIREIQESFESRKEGVLSTAEHEANTLKENMDSLKEEFISVSGDINDQTELLKNAVDRIRAEQDEYIKETELFSRTDELRENLTLAIDTLKEKIEDIQDRSGYIGEVDDRLTQVKELSDKLSERINRLKQDQSKIESLEGRVDKVLSLSETVNEKLEHIARSDESLDEIQLKLRKLEELEKEIKLEYERLENKSGILDETSRGIDTGFRKMEELEERLSSYKEELTPFNDRLGEVDDRINSVESHKKKLDSVITHISSLKDIIADIEERTEKMEKARQWLASVETRLDEALRTADEQIKLMGALSQKKDGAPQTDAAGSPDMNMREMVIKLAHNGWKPEDISRTTKLSRGEVELILELSPRR